MVRDGGCKNREQRKSVECSVLTGGIGWLDGPCSFSLARVAHILFPSTPCLGLIFSFSPQLLLLIPKKHFRHILPKKSPLSLPPVHLILEATCMWLPYVPAPKSWILSWIL